MIKIDNRVERILFSPQQIESAIQKTAKWIDKNYKNKKPILIAVLKGVIPFYGRIITNVKTDIFLDCMVLSSYKGNVKAITEPKVIMDVKSDIKDRHIVIIEDIVDTGKTLKAVVNMLKKRKPKSIKVVTLLDKKSARTVEFTPDYNCFIVPNEYIVGFGFDFQESLRNLPYIGVLRKDIYNNNLKGVNTCKKSI